MDELFQEKPAVFFFFLNSYYLLLYNYFSVKEFNAVRELEVLFEWSRRGRYFWRLSVNESSSVPAPRSLNLTKSYRQLIDHASSFYWPGEPNSIH